VQAFDLSDRLDAKNAKKDPEKFPVKFPVIEISRGFKKLLRSFNVL
jgi:hypothetical protein